MHAVVAHVAGSEVIPPRPTVVDSIGAIGNHRGRPDPVVVIEAGRWSGVLPASNRTAPLDVPAFGDHHVTDDPVAQQLHGVDHHRGAAALSAVLHQCLIASGCLDQQPPLADVVRDRLLDVDVLAGIAGQDRGDRVPMIGRGDHDRIDGLVIQHPPQIGNRSVRRNLKRFSRGGSAVVIDVADVGDFDVRCLAEQSGVVIAAASAADQADHQLVVRALGSGLRGTDG